MDYEEAVEAIWRFECCPLTDEQDITTLYANGKPFEQVIHRANGDLIYSSRYAQAETFSDLDVRNVADLYSEDYELQRKVLIQRNANLQDVVELLENGDICYADAREWCMNNSISLGQFDRRLYAALRKPDEPIPAEPKEPWPYRLVAFINRILEILINSILEDFV